MKNSKVMWIDLETTGLDNKRHDIIQLAYLIEIDKKIIEEGQFNMQPFNYETIDERALEINKTTIGQLKTYEAPQETHRKLKKVLEKYIDNYTRGHDRFSPAGFNVGFDVGFLREFFFKNNDTYYNSFFDYHLLSIDSLLYLFDYQGLIKLENYKLATVAKHFGIEYSEHNALSDIKATREVFYKLLGYFK